MQFDLLDIGMARQRRPFIIRKQDQKSEQFSAIQVFMTVIKFPWMRQLFSALAQESGIRGGDCEN